MELKEIKIEESPAGVSTPASASEASFSTDCRWCLKVLLSRKAEVSKFLSWIFMIIFTISFWDLHVKYYSFEKCDSRIGLWLSVYAITGSVNLGCCLCFLVCFLKEDISRLTKFPECICSIGFMVLLVASSVLKNLTQELVC